GGDSPASALRGREGKDWWLHPVGDGAQLPECHLYRRLPWCISSKIPEVSCSSSYSLWQPLFCAPVLCDLIFRRCNNHVRTEAKLLHELFQRRRGSKRFDSDILTFRTGVLAPSEVGCHLHRHPCFHLRRQDAFAICAILLLKQLPRWHADDSRLHSI